MTIATNLFEKLIEKEFCNKEKQSGRTHGSFKKESTKKETTKDRRRIQTLGFTFLAHFHFGIFSEKLPNMPFFGTRLVVSPLVGFHVGLYRGKKLPNVDH